MKQKEKAMAKLTDEDSKTSQNLENQEDAKVQVANPIEHDLKSQ